MPSGWKRRATTSGFASRHALTPAAYARSACCHRSGSFASGAVHRPHARQSAPRDRSRPNRDRRLRPNVQRLAPDQLHLQQPVLGSGVTQTKEAIHLGCSKHVRDAPRVAEHFDVAPIGQCQGRHHAGQQYQFQNPAWQCPLSATDVFTSHHAVPLGGLIARSSCLLSPGGITILEAATTRVNVPTTS